MAEIAFNETYSEIFKLHEMLKEADIPHDFIERKAGRQLFVYQILYPNKESWDNMLPGEMTREMTCSIISGPTTCGGNKNLLEAIGLSDKSVTAIDDLIGYLSAENVFKELVKIEEQRKLEFKNIPKDCKEDT